jgi:methionyl-tRNA formyltransferase
MRVAWVSFDVIGRDCLEAAAEGGAEVVAVVTLPGPIDPDRSGQCDFGEVAARTGARLVETRDVNSQETIAALREAVPELIFVVGWSQLVRDELISLAPGGVFGMHPTLLPRHRGRAPIPWTILSGLATTGVTLFEIADATADSGPIVGQVEVVVAADETATTLFDRLAEAHVELIREHLPGLLAGTAPRLPQDPRRASAWQKRTPADGIIDWETRAPYLYDWVRAQTRPYPGAFTFLGDTRIVVWRAAAAALGERAPAGTVVRGVENGVVVACGDGALVLEEVEPEGAGVFEGPSIGKAIPVGARLG